MTKPTETPAPGTNPPPGDRPARPRDLIGNADKAAFKVYQYIKVDGSDAPADAHDLRYLATVHADTREDACWAYSESEQGRTGAMSDNPPKLVAMGTGRGGLPEPKTYPLEPAVRRKR